ncbi:MAG: HU family DNA-binding protein [Lachnospiraceae bacterium]|nr:HU family DNA-binding protein [Lachnospiraceae bacterium]
MNKKELIAAIAEEANVSKKDAAVVFDATFKVIGKALENGEKISVSGFGTFDVHERKARTGKNPRTGEAVEILASKSPAFKPSQVLKAGLNK